jgi:primosomal protein N' (replication factor Y)
MVCHYTGYTARPPEVCPECGSLDLGFSGFGTERIEEDLARSFPQLRVRRLDSDVVQRKGVLEETIESFRQGEIDLLLGTQMVAKGLNFPGVKLVGVILADAGLEVPDFRSAERTFALIVQVSGRAGRYVADGKVLIQTYRPSHEAIVLASHADVEGFYDRELDLRERLGFPPFTRLIRLVVRGKNRRRVEQAAADIRASSMKLGGDSPGFEMLGPAECPISLLSNNYRVHILYRAKDFRRMHEAISGVVFAYKPATGVHLEVDVDPVSLL